MTFQSVVILTRPLRIVDLLTSAAMIGPLLLGLVIALGASMHAMWLRAGQPWFNIGWMFPPHAVGLGDILVVYGVMFLCALWLRKHERVMDGGLGMPSSLMIVAPSHGLAGSRYWGGAAAAMFDPAARTSPHIRGQVIVAAGLTAVLYHVGLAIAIGIAFMLFPGTLGVFVHGVKQPWCALTLTVCAPGSSSIQAALLGAMTVATMVALLFLIADIAFGSHRVWVTLRTVREVSRRSFAQPNQVSGPEGALQVVHLTDFHFVGDDAASRCEKPERPPFGNESVVRSLLSLQGEIEVADLLVLSGDLTDAGTEAEWTQFDWAVSRLGQAAREKVFVVPGNHDLNYVAPLPHAARTQDTELLHGRAYRQCMFAKFCEPFVRECQIVTIDDDGRISFSKASTWFDEQLPEMNNYVRELQNGRLVPPPASTLDWQIPPYVRRISRGALRLAVIGIDTSGWGATAAVNAIGSEFGMLHYCVTQAAAQLATEGLVPIVVGHHAMLPLFEIGAQSRHPTSGLVQSIQVAGMAQLYGDEWFRSLAVAVKSPGFLYLHGHRHVSRQVACTTGPESSAYLLGAPSITFGDEWTLETGSIGMLHTIWIEGSPGPGQPTLSVATQTLHRNPATKTPTHARPIDLAPLRGLIQRPGS